MIFVLLTLSSLLFAQESFFIYRVDQNNHLAVISTAGSDHIKVGDKFKIQTPEGFCHTPVTEIINGFFYVNTEQCRNEDVKKGTMIVSADPIMIPEALPRTVAQTPMPSNAASSPVASTSPTSADSSVSMMSNFKNTAFYKKFVTDKLSTYVGYHAGNNLDGQMQVTSNSTITEVSGAHTIGIGAEYKIVDLPYNLDTVGGISYNLPRSYGSYTLQRTNGNSSIQNFSSNPELQLWSFYVNMRYRFDKNIYGYVGFNRLAAYMSNLPGEMNGDFGFHTGARYYPIERFFVDGTVNFYNMNYTYAGRTTDVSLTELEIKGGYTF